MNSPDTSINEPWEPNHATLMIREIANDPRMGLAFKRHASERLAERGILMSDVLYILKNGFVHEKAVNATQPGSFKYCIECKTPNSGAREVRLIAILREDTFMIKLVTIMWVDEKSTRAGGCYGGNV